MTRLNEQTTIECQPHSRGQDAYFEPILYPAMDLELIRGDWRKVVTLVWFCDLASMYDVRMAKAHPRTSSQFRVRDDLKHCKVLSRIDMLQVHLLYPISPTVDLHVAGSRATLHTVFQFIRPSKMGQMAVRINPLPPGDVKWLTQKVWSRSWSLNVDDAGWDPFSIQSPTLLPLCALDDRVRERMYCTLFGEISHGVW